MDISVLLKKLIRADSTPEAGELAAARVLEKYFSGFGLAAKVDVWDTKRANVIVRVNSTGERPGLVFGSHLDVVPAGDIQWKYPPFEAIQQDGLIHGRGSTDMKAGIAASAAAITELISEGAVFKGDVIFAATAGEESDSCGIKRYIQQDRSSMPKLAGVIIPEPTDFEIITAHRGILWLRISTHGKTAHGSMPHLGINAVYSMNELIAVLKDYQIPCEEHPQFGKCSLSVNRISGGKAANVVPDKCDIDVDIRTLPGQSAESVMANLRNLFEQLTRKNPQFKAEIEIIRSVEAMEMDTDCQFIREMCECVAINRTRAVGYTTDGPYFAQLGAPVVVFGPGKTELCHKPDEYVELVDVENAKEHFKKIIKHQCL